MVSNIPAGAISRGKSSPEEPEPYESGEESSGALSKHAVPNGVTGLDGTHFFGP